jgi:uncharacterized membrane protein
VVYGCKDQTWVVVLAGLVQIPSLDLLFPYMDIWKIWVGAFRFSNCQCFNYMVGQWLWHKVIIQPFHEGRKF